MAFKYTINSNTETIDFQQVAELLEKVGLVKTVDADLQEKVFRNSDEMIFVKDGDRIIGVGRALSDGIAQAAIYNIAVDPDYQRQQVGHTIISLLLDRLRGLNIILYTHPKTLRLYEKYGFRRNKTAFANFQAVDQEGFQWMEDEGFFLPEHFRFDDEKGRY